MFQGSMRGNISLTGYYEGNLFFGPRFLLVRHNELTMHLKGELINHRTPITEATIAEATAKKAGLKYSSVVYEDIEITREMIKQSRMDLLSRCTPCRSLHLKEKREGRSHRYTVNLGSNPSDIADGRLESSRGRSNT